LTQGLLPARHPAALTASTALTIRSATFGPPRVAGRDVDGGSQHDGALADVLEPSPDG
jgi:hypothetical protein